MANDHEIITKDSPRIAAFLETINRLDQGVAILEAHCKPAVSGEGYLNEKQAMQLLKISRRSLLYYRTAGLIPYYLVGRRILYKVSEIEAFLKKNYLPAFR